MTCMRSGRPAWITAAAPGDTQVRWASPERHVDRTPRPPAPVHGRGFLSGDPASRRAVGRHHGGRHLPCHRHPRRGRRMELPRSFGRGHGAAGDARQRARHFLVGQRRLAHRLAEHRWNVGPARLLRAGVRHRGSDRPDHVGVAVGRAHHAAGDAAPRGAPVQRLERDGGAAYALRYRHRAADVRLGFELGCGSSPA